MEYRYCPQWKMLCKADACSELTLYHPLEKCREFNKELYMDTNEIAQLISDKEKALKISLQTQEIVDKEEIDLSKQILELRIKKKDIEQAQSKARHNVKMLQLEIKNLTNKFWQSKQTGV